jgi:ABC-type sugar transport system substrate-binding protein
VDVFSENWLRRRRGVGAVAAVAVMIAAAGCGSSSSGSSSSSSASSAAASSTTGGGSSGSSTTAASSSAGGKKVTVGYILAAPVSALEAIGNGIKKESAKLGMNFTEVSADFNPDQQLAAMQALEAKGVNVIISAPLDPSAFFSAAQKAQSKGIHVLTYNDPGKGISYAVTNPDTQEATDIVGTMAKQLKSEGKPCDIGIIEGQPTTPPLERRNVGFEAGAKANDCTVLATQVVTQTTPAEGSSTASTWKARFGSKMTGIAVVNDDVALGVLPARTGTFSPLVVSMNGEPAAVSAVKNGSMFADGGLENAVMGLSLAQVSYDLANGKKVPAVAVSPYFPVTKATAAQFNKTYADATVLAASGGTTSFATSGGQTTLKYQP